MMEKVFKAMGSDTRIAILNFLGSGKKTVTDIVGKFKLSQPTISHHLKVLKDVGLVAEEKYKKWIYYRLNSDLFYGIRKFVDKIIKKGG